MDYLGRGSVQISVSADIKKVFNQINNHYLNLI